MRMHYLGIWTVAFGVVVAGPLARADETAQQAPIAGSDVMGDKGRTGPDGWSWAPVTRDQAPSGKAPGQTAANTDAAPNAKPDPGAGKTLAPGDDPGTPMATQPHGPGTQDTSAPRP